MSETLTLKSQLREHTGRHGVSMLRKGGVVPAVVYGHGIQSRSLSVELNLFKKLYTQAGESSLIDLVIGSEQPVKVIIHGIQRDPVRDEISHIDFHQVKMDEKIKAEVELVFEGVSPAVKELGGILVKNITNLEIECLPSDLPHDIAVDISVLKTFEDLIRVSDLILPNGVTSLIEETSSVISVSEPRSEEELKALEEAVVEDVGAVQVEGIEEGVEGEEAVVEDVEAEAGTDKESPKKESTVKKEE